MSVAGELQQRRRGAGLWQQARAVWRYRDLIRVLVVRNIKVKYQRSALGLLWTLLNPLLMLLILMAVFTTPVSTDPDAVAYQYHKNSWGKYYGSAFYTNADVWGLIERARTVARWEERAPLYADSRSASPPTRRRCSACSPTAAGACATT